MAAPVATPLDPLNPTLSGSGAPTQSGAGADPLPGSGFFPSSNSLFQELEQQYNQAPKAFSTTQFDTAEAQQEGNITTAAEQSANAAAAEYANRARQQGGSGEASGLIKAEGQVAGQRNVADIKLQAAQYDIAQREAAANLQATIADNLGKLRDSYLSSLAGYRGEQLRSTTQLGVANIESQTQESINAARIAEENYEFRNKPLVVPPGDTVFGSLAAVQGFRGNQGASYIGAGGIPGGEELASDPYGFLYGGTP